MTASFCFLIWRLTVKLFRFWRLTVNFWPIWRLTVNPIETLIQDTAPSLELRHRNSGFRDCQHRQNRKREWKDDSENKSRHMSTGEHVTLRIYRYMYPQSIDANATANQNKEHWTNQSSFSSHMVAQKSSISRQLKSQDNSNNLLHHRRSSDHGSSYSHRTEPQQIQPQNITVCTREESTGTLKTTQQRYKNQKQARCYCAISRKLWWHWQIAGWIPHNSRPFSPTSGPPPRKLPISMKEEIKKELNDMITNNIIAIIREGEPTAWVKSL